MHKIQIPSLLPFVFLLAIPISAFKIHHVRKTADGTAYNSTTTCLTPTWGGCCLSNADGTFSSCLNATLVAASVTWTGIPTTETANEWACTELESAEEVKIPTCCKWEQELVRRSIYFLGKVAELIVTDGFLHFAFLDSVVCLLEYLYYYLEDRPLII